MSGCLIFSHNSLVLIRFYFVFIWITFHGEQFLCYVCNSWISSSMVSSLLWVPSLLLLHAACFLFRFSMHVFFIALFFYSFQEYICLLKHMKHSYSSCLDFWLLRHMEHSYISCLDFWLPRHMEHSYSSCSDTHLLKHTGHSYSTSLCTSGLFLFIYLLVLRFSPTYMCAWKFWLKAMCDSSLARCCIPLVSSECYLDFALWYSWATQNQLILQCLCWALLGITVFYLGLFWSGLSPLMLNV